jgi:hypothetical protein
VEKEFRNLEEKKNLLFINGLMKYVLKDIVGFVVRTFMVLDFKFHGNVWKIVSNLGAYIH